MDEGYQSLKNSAVFGYFFINSGCKLYIGFLSGLITKPIWDGLLFTSMYHFALVLWS